MHHATTHSGGGGLVDGQRVYNCVCDFCGESFTAVATDLEQTYNTILDDDEIKGVNNENVYYFNAEWYCSPTGGVDSSTEYEQIAWNTMQFKVVKVSNGETSWKIDFTPSADIIVQIPASLSSVNSFTGQTLTNNFILAENNEAIVATDGSKPISYHCKANVSYQLRGYFHVKISTWGCQVGDVFTIKSDLPKIAYTYYAPTEVDLYDRPSTFAPSFTYEDGDGWQVHVGLDGNKLIDETNLTYYNPVTNTTTNIQNWSYDYSDRSYTVLTDSNNTTTITYGDEYITINEGDNITYNIYYYTEPDSSGDGSGGSGSGSDGNNSSGGTGIWGKLGELLGTLLGGLIDLITGVIDGLLDSLISLVRTTLEKLGEVINLFGSFGDALRSLWAWLPDEIIMILTAGVSVVVFASVLKLFI